MTIRSLISAARLHDKLTAAKLLHAANPAASAASAAAADFRVCDATVTGPDPEGEFLRRHIPSATFFDLNECADVESGLIRTVPSAAVFEDYVNSVGIRNDTRIVAYDSSNGFGGFFSAPRVWWLFRLFGHDNVCVLNGGFHKWLSLRLPTASLESPPAPSSTSGRFNATYRPHLHKSFDQLQANSETQSFQVIDGRSKPDFLTARIAKSDNLFFARVIDKETGEMKTSTQLQHLFKEVGVELTAPREPEVAFVASCVTGTTACALGLAAAVAGEAAGVAVEAAVYDGSWQEWVRRGGAIDV